jgi:hypothetical protein|tara:strand:+ start:29117 stop:29329 length:213 start_codon:yes stop_codon:yes gene_type:complete
MITISQARNNINKHSMHCVSFEKHGYLPSNIYFKVLANNDSTQEQIRKRLIKECNKVVKEQKYNSFKIIY